MLSTLSAKTKLAGFFADPNQHSKSPFIYNQAFQLIGLDYCYLSFQVNKTNLEEALNSVRILDMAWVNLSMPNKQAALKYLDEVSPEAKLIGAVNTVVNHSGKLIGHNTDGEGLLLSLQEKNWQPENKIITIFGGGGAAISVIAHLALKKAKKITVCNRKSQRYPLLQKQLIEISGTTHCEIQLIDLNDLPAVTHSVEVSHLIINATSLGMGKLSDKSPLTKDVFLKEQQLLVDLIYEPTETLFLKQGKQQGAKTMNGLGMLLYQAKAAFKLGTGKELPVTEIKKLLINQN